MSWDLWPSPNIVQLFGSFRQLGSYSLLLEYVDGGNFADYLKSTSPPKAVEDITVFWTSLFGVLNGLDTIHQPRRCSVGYVGAGYVGFSRYIKAELMAEQHTWVHPSTAYSPDAGVFGLALLL